MARRFDLIVFDWDGTLIDSTASIVAALQAAGRDVGLPVPSDRDAAHVIGLALRDAVAYLFPESDDAVIDQLVARYRYHFLARDHEIRLFVGVPDMLAELRAKGCLLAIATGKARQGLDRALQGKPIASLFDATRCADESFSKPHPAMLLELMEKLTVAPERTLMIGDTSHDLDMARNAGVASLGVLHGAHPREVLVDRGALALVNNMEEMWAWLKHNA